MLKNVEIINDPPATPALEPGGVETACAEENMEENSGILDGARVFLVNQQVCPCEIQSLVLASCEMKLD